MKGREEKQDRKEDKIRGKRRKERQGEKAGRGRREREMDMVGRRLFSQNKDVEKGADEADTSRTGTSYPAHQVCLPRRRGGCKPTKNVYLGS